MANAASPSTFYTVGSQSGGGGAGGAGQPGIIIIKNTHS